MTTYGLYGLPEPERPPRPPSKWRWPIRIITGITVCVLIVLFLLSRQGGNSDSLKQFLQTYISDSTGYQAEIGTLNALSFYPVLGVDMDDLVLRSRGDQQIMARFEHLNFSVGFWGAAAGQSAIRTFSIKNGVLSAGLITPKEMKLADFRIQRDSPDSPVLALRGEYGGQALTATAALKRKTNIFGANSYVLADDKKFVMDAGPIRLDSVLGVGANGQRTITILSLETGPNIHPLKGLVEISRGLNNIRFAGNLRGGATHINYDVDTVRQDALRQMTGHITAPTLDLNDIYAKGGFADAYHALDQFYYGDQKEDKLNASAFKFDLRTKVEKLSYGPLLLGSVFIPVTSGEGTLQIGPVTGKIGHADLIGDILMDLAKDQVTQKTTLQLLEKGKTALRLEAVSSGSTLLSDLRGNMTVMVSGHNFSAPLQALWDGKLLNALLPEKTGKNMLDLNCGIGDVALDGGVMNIQTLFLDFADFDIAGTGKLALDPATLDMTLSPVEGAAGVKTTSVRGALNNPSIQGKTAAQGRIPHDLQPAFSLSVLGLDAQHPCKAYLTP